MAQPFDVDVVLEGEAAKRFREYDRGVDKNPLAYETPESMKIIRAAREIAKTL